MSEPNHDYLEKITREWVDMRRRLDRMWFDHTDANRIPVRVELSADDLAVLERWLKSTSANANAPSTYRGLPVVPGHETIIVANESRGLPRRLFRPLDAGMKTNPVAAEVARIVRGDK